MAAYSYLLLDEHGNEIEGEIEADNQRAAAQKLKSGSGFVLEIRSGGGGVSDPGQRWSWPKIIRHINFSRYLPVGQADVIQFFRQNALMLRAGHTLVQSLDMMAALAHKPRLRREITAMSDGVRNGASLSTVMAARHKLFPEMMSRLIASGEKSGELDPIMDRLADDIERKRDLNRELYAALIYPAIVFCGAIGVVVMLAVWVIPRFSKFLHARNVAIPETTRFLIAFSDWFVVHGVTFGIVTFMVVFLLLAAYTTVSGKKKIDSVLLWIPVIGKSIRSAAMAQAGWTLAMLLRSGVTVFQALQITAKIMGNRSLTDSFSRAAESVLAGNSIGVSFEQPAIPQMVRHLAEVGEKSGELEQVMEAVGKYYRKELEARMKTITAWIEPVMILLVGGMVGFVYLAFFQAALKVSTGGM